jgi:hypothetical protein
MELTSRELATVLLFAAFIGLAFLLSKDRKGLIHSFGGVLKAFSAWKVWLVVVAYLAYSTGIVLLAKWMGIWSLDLLKDTIIIVFFTGLPILFNMTNFKDGSAVVKKVLGEVVGVSALLVVYLNLAPFPLWGELILQAVLAFLVLVSAVAKLDPKTAAVARVFNVLITLTALGLLVYVTVQIITNFGSFDWGKEASAFALSIWLPLMQLPFVYGFGLFAASEMAIVRLRLHNNHENPPLKVRLALLLGFRGRLRYASRFSLRWIPELARERSFRQARRTMRDYRAAVRDRARQQRERRLRLKKFAGASGVDEKGLWLDRREFSETKKALADLYFTQMGVYRNRGGRYLEDPRILLTSWSLKGLPEDHGIEIKVSRDRQAWSGWRRTVGGYYFGIGGSDDVDERWEYDDASPPADLPTVRTSGWRETTQADRSAEWEASDDPVPDV